MHHSLTPVAQKLENAYIPEVRHEATTTRSRLEPNDSDDRGEEVAALFEWVGMASFLSPRLVDSAPNQLQAHSTRMLVDF